MQLNDADLLNVERELCKRSLAHFAQRAWHVLEPAAELKWGWALDAICLHLEAVTNGEILRLLMNVPPGSMKSLLTGVIWPAWEWGPRGMPEMRFVGTAHEETLAIRDNRKCRDLITSDWYQKLWQIEMAADLNGKREFGNTKKGFRQARSFTSMTGVRGDRWNIAMRRGEYPPQVRLTFSTTAKSPKPFTYEGFQVHQGELRLRVRAADANAKLDPSAVDWDGLGAALGEPHPRSRP